MAADFKCPNCGGGSFRADYFQAVHQGCTLVIEEGGDIHAEDFDGDEETYDDGCTQDDRYACDLCGWSITVGDWTFSERKPEAFSVECRMCGGSRKDIAARRGCAGCCRDCGFPCDAEKNEEGFHA